MRVRVHLPAALRPLAGERADLALDLIDGATLQDLLNRLRDAQPALERRVRDERGQLRRYVNVYVDGVDVRDAAAQATPLHEGSEVLVIPSVAGG